MTNQFPLMPLGEVLNRSEDVVVPHGETVYQEVTVRLWGKGVAQRRQVTGMELNGGRRFVARSGQFILSRIDARNGASGLIPESLDGAIVTNDFPLFNIQPSKLLPKYLSWLARTKQFVDLCKEASEGTTNRVRLQEERFLKQTILLPPLTEQRRIVARIEELAAKIEEARGLRNEVEKKRQVMLESVFHRIASTAPRRALGEVAPLHRRPITVDIEEQYEQVAVRSFGRGTFHKPPLVGSEVTWQKPFLVKAGDVLISNIKAWEGAIAVATPQDDGRVGSHRYLTCVPVEGVATARFVCFYLLTPEGLYAVGEASPGSADRNRTLGVKPFLQIPVPVPPFDRQLWFDDLCERLDALKKLQEEAAKELDALLPSVLDRAFKGEL